MLLILKNVLSTERKGKKTMSKYRKKPVVIDAFLLDSNSGAPHWFLQAVETGVVEIHHKKKYILLKIKTLEGTMKAKEGDYIIQGVNGEIYPCKADIFEKTYEAVTDDE